MRRKKITREDLPRRITLTVPEARDLTGLTSRMIIDRINSGIIKAKKMDDGKGMYLIDAPSFSEYVTIAIEQ